MAQRTCTIDGCEKPHRARGLCSTHYNAEHQPNRHPAEDVRCAQCGVVVNKRRDSRRPQRFCSLICRDVWRIETGSNPAPPTQTIRFIPFPPDHPAAWIGKSCPLAESTCRECGLRFMHKPRQGRVLCSRRCVEATRLARKLGRKRIKRVSIFVRDNYMCWICDRPTSPTYSSRDLMSPTVDHLVPVAFGGGDEPENLATAHMICNSTRGASWDIAPAA